jgi:hypothetical protein
MLQTLMLKQTVQTGKESSPLFNKTELKHIPMGGK